MLIKIAFCLCSDMSLSLHGFLLHNLHCHSLLSPTICAWLTCSSVYLSTLNVLHTHYHKWMLGTIWFQFYFLGLSLFVLLYCYHISVLLLFYKYHKITFKTSLTSCGSSSAPLISHFFLKYRQPYWRKACSCTGKKYCGRNDANT